MIFARPARVYRAMYSGRGIIAPNTEFSPELEDKRGYLPVEWWIMSKTEARNATPINNEGAHYDAHGAYTLEISLMKVDDTLLQVAVSFTAPSMQGYVHSNW